ncbi:SCO family protein [Hephaestia sp. GCM10023244]|uniref:SCO family protein n=1 Tax=unclassified Hephaestia TaxID=2631281 RepID=UPI0020775F12|nr:SCO family protein [Hephaestia sp. MAHUQ-44]MCM8731168.1 SCO family protein [Hephaestia sp. MAHUQ-44]
MNQLRPAFFSALLLAVAACSPQPDATNTVQADPPLEGAAIGGPFTLIGEDGKPVSDSAFAGKYRIMYFGYTFCPDVCPVDMQNLGAAMRLLDQNNPTLSAKIQPIFVTVDPARDTPAVLREFTDAFYPRLLGLTGDPAAIAAVTKEYAVYSKIHAPGPGGGYLVDHTRTAYLMSPEGKPLALLPVEGPPQPIVDEIERWAK